jgi:hypothetical protein
MKNSHFLWVIRKNGKSLISEQNISAVEVQSLLLALTVIIPGFFVPYGTLQSGSHRKKTLSVSTQCTVCANVLDYPHE